MKKYCTLLALVLVLVLILSACGNAPEQSSPAVVQTVESPEEVTATNPPQAAESLAEELALVKDPAKATTEPETEETVWEWDIDAELFCFPFLKEICGAEIIDVSQVEDGQIQLVYKNADEDTLEEFLYYCSTCGLYANQYNRDDNLILYDLKPVGVAYNGIVALDPEAKQMLILTENVNNAVTEDQLREHLAYYEQELSFPADFGKNVFPQFYATIGEPQPMGRVGSDIYYIFDGDKFWCEWYSDVSYLELRRYIDEMILCGFDVRLVTGILDDNGALSTAVLHFSNGDADVALSYDYEDESVSIYYETGTMWTLLYGEDYATYIPKK